MNYSSAFKTAVSNFVNGSSDRPFARINIQDIDESNVLCYMKNTPILSPYFIPIWSRETDVVVPILGPKNKTPMLVNKAEEILLHTALNIKKFLLDGKVYHSRWGCVWDENKIPIMLMCRNPRNLSDTSILCIDYSVFENPEEPLNRFIMRKVLPYVINSKDTGIYKKYMFSNNRMFVIKPTFQNELDHKLVGEFLANKIKNEVLNK